ncbi:MAG TPA: hypothetical protein VJZ00_09995 [Thermoanaerobaculia bacterium]|nr:hypothetical protein [Thermoanaerobaculia bacterium]
MKRTSLFLALIVASALPALAQTTSEFGVIASGSRRFIDGAPREEGVEFIESNFSFSKNAFDIYWKIPLEEDTAVKLRAGRIETPVAFAYEVAGNPNTFRADVNGEVQHIEAGVEYSFSEIFGSSGLFAGVGLYRQSGPGFDSTTNFGASFGVNADFPITRRYGIVVDGTYHWVRADFQPRFLTVGAGVRVSF